MSTSKANESGRSQQDANNWRQRHGADTVARLEELFKESSHPGEARRNQIGEELGLEPDQVKFWFQNKKTQMRTISERLYTNALRNENEMIKSENQAMKEALENLPLTCGSCGGRSMELEERGLSLHLLKAENTLLTQRCERIKEFLARNGLNPKPLPTFPSSPSSQDVPPGSMLNAGNQLILNHDNHIPAPTSTPLTTPSTNQTIPTLDDPSLNPSKDLDSVLMLKMANNAVEELTKLISLNEPFWFKSLLDGKWVLQRDRYIENFGWSSCLNNPHARMESSKDSRVVKMGGAQLVEMFLNSDKWIDLFPTIIKKAQTLKVLESGLLGNQNGAVQLMKAKMHILSHLVPTREFLFLRYCKQLEVGAWVIGDVSIDSSTNKTLVSRAWRLPSGCLIKELAEGLCKVSWVEHVEVDDKMQTHPAFREVICGNNAFGAERWAMTLERMCERFASASAKTVPNCEAEGVIKSCNERRNIMQLTHRMVKSFCGNLEMQYNPNFPFLTKMNNRGIWLSVRVNNTEPDAPKGMIIRAATCFHLSLSPPTVVDYLIDNKKRAKWDVLCNGSAGHEIQRISTGTNPGNCISIMRPFIPKENNTVILQESYVDHALGSMLVYAPLDIELLNLAMKGEDTSLFPILSSGISISWDGQTTVPLPHEGQYGEFGKSGGSLVTLMFQVLASSPSKMDTVNTDQIVGHINQLVASTVENIKAGLNCSNLK